MKVYTWLRGMNNEFRVILPKLSMQQVQRLSTEPGEEFVRLDWTEEVKIKLKRGRK